MNPTVYFVCSGVAAGHVVLTWIDGVINDNFDRSGLGLLMLASAAFAAIGEWVS